MVRIAELVTEVDLVNVPATITQGQSASVTVRATDLSSSNSYTVRIALIGFSFCLTVAIHELDFPSSSR